MTTIELHDAHDDTATLQGDTDYSQGPGYLLVQVAADSGDSAGLYLSREQVLTLAAALLAAARELDA